MPRQWQRERRFGTEGFRKVGSVMLTVDLSRAQFASTTVYHFLFVPVTIGLAFFVAILQTIWHRSGDPGVRRLTRFFGTLLLINVAIGVVTGLVQEFEFGMNWSAYSRFVGDVFGGPLAMEGLAAFFLESTFLGLWVFGWDRLPKRHAPGLHLARRRRHRALCGLHHGCQLVDAAPSRLHHQLEDRPGANSTTSALCSPTPCSSGATRTSFWLLPLRGHS